MVEKADFTVTGEMTIHCAGCEQRIHNALHRLPGIEAVEASAQTQRVVVHFDPAQVDPDQVQSRLEEIGYRVRSGGID